MKLALIPPISLRHTAVQSRYHLVLPQLLEARDEYFAMYYTIAKEIPGNFIILDNGEAEGAQVDFETLISYAAELDADEVVLPDVMKDAQRTIHRIEEFLQWYDNSEWGGGRRRNFMFVAQGTTYEEVQSMMGEVMEDKEMSKNISAVGIPRHLVETLNDNQARVELAYYFHERYSNSDYAPVAIHFLGASPVYVEEVGDLQSIGIGRGMDTSLPYNATYHSVELGGLTPDVVSRPDGYFDLDHQAFNSQLLEKNIHTMMDWAHGRTNS